MTEKSATMFNGRYYWILANSEAGNFVDPQTEHCAHTFYNPKSKTKRQDYDTSTCVDKGDRLIGYARAPERIVAVFEVVNKVVELEGGQIEFRRIKLLANPVEWRELKEKKTLKGAFFPNSRKRYMEDLSNRRDGDAIWQFVETQPAVANAVIDGEVVVRQSAIDNAQPAETKSVKKESVAATPKTEHGVTPPDALDDLDAHKAELDTLEQTEREAVRKSRIGQGQFRQDLIDYWNVCAVTGCSEQKVLRASHIKRWSDCKNSQERLDHFNGLLLVAHLDALFEAGLISFADSGQILRSQNLSEKDCQLLGINDDLKLRKLEDGHRKYLSIHREKHDFAN